MSIANLLYPNNQQLHADYLQIDGVTNAAAAISINAPKVIQLGRLTTLQRLTLSNVAAGSICFDTTIGALFLWDGSSWVSMSLSGDGVEEITSTDGSLVITDASGPTTDISVADTLTLDAINAKTLSGVAISGNLNVAGNQTTVGSLSLKNGSGSSGSITLQATAGSYTPVTFTLPSSAGSNGQVLTTNGSGGLTFANVSIPSTVSVDEVQALSSAGLTLDGGSGPVTLQGTQLNLPAGYTIQGSTGLSIHGNKDGVDSGTLSLYGSGIECYSGGSMWIYGTDTRINGLQWPASDGTSGQVLSTNGTGQLSWASAAAYQSASDVITLTCDAWNAGTTTMNIAAQWSGNVVTLFFAGAIEESKAQAGYITGTLPASFPIMTGGNQWTTIFIQDDAKLPGTLIIKPDRTFEVQTMDGGEINQGLAVAALVGVLSGTVQYYLD